MAEPVHFRPERLPLGSTRKISGGWWGVQTLIITEACLFGYLLFCFFYLNSQSEQEWPPEGLPGLLVPGVNTLILLISSACVWFGEKGVKHDRAAWSISGLAAAVILGTCFVGIQLVEWSNKTYGLTTNLYGSLYFTITGFHMAHVIIGLVVLSFLLLWAGLGYFDSKRHEAVTIGAAYWHFVDVVWLFVFSSLYLFPYF